MGVGEDACVIAGGLLLRVYLVLFYPCLFVAVPVFVAVNCGIEQKFNLLCHNKLFTSVWGSQSSASEYNPPSSLLMKSWINYVMFSSLWLIADNDV